MISKNLQNIRQRLPQHSHLVRNVVYVEIRLIRCMLKVLFVGFTVFFSPIKTLEARTIFEIPTTTKDPVIKNPFIPIPQPKQREKDGSQSSEDNSEEIPYDTNMQNTQSLESIRFRSDKHHLEEIENTEMKLSIDETGNESMKQFVTVCTNSFAHVKWNNLFTCIWQGFEAI
ncbi:hypothetical protein HHI36_001285 [Cryptolaemus montrouzieri]|uniref:Uncharacterized protein n=1 Tax=Cryptolaemus montrouzieri TaxID=559131 RepID=A0ABD2P7U8_9CUCU